MDALLDLRADLIKLKESGINDLIKIIVNDNSDFFEDTLTDQMLEGLDGNGNAINPKYRSDTYARVKQFLNSKPSFGTPDLKLTGSFHKGIQLLLRGENIEFTSTDGKTADLTYKYGDEILELNDVSIELIQNELILPLLLEAIEHKLIEA